MRIAGSICSDVLKSLEDMVKPGMSTNRLAAAAADMIKARGAKPSFLGYQGFPAVICISINDEVVHGIPNNDRIIKSGDIISFDLGVTYKRMIVDSAISVLVDSREKEKLRLIEATRKSLSKGIEELKDGCKTGDVGSAVEEVLDKEKLGIIRDLVGHGVGHQVHEEPNIPNYGERGSGHTLRAGMTVAIEPMATLGAEGVYIDSDNWTIKTKDKSLSAHFEQTVLITPTGYEILTPFK